MHVGMNKSIVGMEMEGIFVIFQFNYVPEKYSFFCFIVYFSMLIPNLKSIFCGRLKLSRYKEKTEYKGNPRNTFNNDFQFFFVLFSIVFFDADSESEVSF